MLFRYGKFFCPFGALSGVHSYSYTFAAADLSHGKAALVCLVTHGLERAQKLRPFR